MSGHQLGPGRLARATGMGKFKSEGWEKPVLSAQGDYLTGYGCGRGQFFIRPFSAFPVRPAIPRVHGPKQTKPAKQHQQSNMFGGNRKKDDKPSSLAAAMTPDNAPSSGGGRTGGGGGGGGGSSVTGFDPEGLERAAKAARELDASRNASAAIELIKTQEGTKQVRRSG